jgi:hypothetical protein
MKSTYGVAAASLAAARRYWERLASPGAAPEHQSAGSAAHTSRHDRDQADGGVQSRVTTVPALTVSTALTTGAGTASARPVRARPLLPFVSPAMPPPAMIATGHITAGGTSAITAALAITPAAAPPGSRRHAWSTPGM